MIEHTQIVRDDLVSAALPTVVVYGDGYVVFRSEEKGGRWHRRAGFVESRQRDRILSNKSLLTKFESLSGAYYVVPNVTDIDVVSVCLRLSEALRCVSVHGFWISEELIETLHLRHNDDVPVKVPDAFHEAYDFIQSIPLRVTESKPWSPLAFRVRLSRFEGDRECKRSIVSWPTKWPTLGSAKPIDRGGEILELIVDQKEERRVLELYEESSEGHPVQIEGGLFHMWYFPVLPDEECWIGLVNRP